MEQIDEFNRLVPWVGNFRAQVPHGWVVENNYQAPAIAAVVYLLCVFVILPELRPERCGPIWRHLFALWNLFLSVFSTAGVAVCLPYLVHVFQTKGLYWAVCSDDLMWGEPDSIAACNGAVGVMMTAFMASKFPELLDTFFLVWMKKPVAFLHWYHHVTVLLYCWFAYRNATPTAVIFAIMNYCVHSVMYFYFAASTYTKALSFMRQPITTMQLAQMFFGVGLTVISYYYDQTAACSKTYSTSGYFYFCSALYGSYFVLFAKLFFDNYVRVKPSKKPKSA